MIKDINAITPEYMKHRIEEEAQQYKQEIERLNKLISQREKKWEKWTTEKTILSTRMSDYLCKYQNIKREYTKQIKISTNRKKEIERLGNELQVQIEDNTRLNEYIEAQEKKLQQKENIIKGLDNTIENLEKVVENKENKIKEVREYMEHYIEVEDAPINERIKIEFKELLKILDKVDKKIEKLEHMNSRDYLENRDEYLSTKDIALDIETLRHWINEIIDKVSKGE